jgi:hypothetical protein
MSLPLVTKINNAVARVLEEETVGEEEDGQKI